VSGRDSPDGRAAGLLDAVTFIDVWDLLIRAATPWHGIVEWNVGFFAVLIPGHITVDTRHDVGLRGGSDPGPKGTTSGYNGTSDQSRLERTEALELLGMTLAHLNDAEARAETSPRVPLLMAIRDKLALRLREEL
jgi:hypothetical protein